MWTFFDFKKALTNCPCLPDVKSLPFWYCTIWLFLTSLEDHQAIIGGPTFLLCYQLKLCEIAPWPLVGSFYLSPLPLQKFQRTGYSLDLPWTVRLTKAKVNSTVSLTFWTLVLFFLLFSFLFIFSFFLIYLLNFNYTDLNIQIEDKLTIKINKKKKWKKNHKIWIIRPVYREYQIPYKK